MTLRSQGVQDAVRPRVAPIPSVDDTAQTHRPRYVRTEPLIAPGGAGAPRAGGPAGVYPNIPLFPGSLHRKSVLLAGALGLVFGPLGLLYSSLLGAFVLSVPAVMAMIVVAFSGSTKAFTAISVASALWGMWAAHRRNVRAQRLHAMAQPMAWR